jgi:ssDNA-binding Zn-finger/Zn-ribbon topoisomerase 1
MENKREHIPPIARGICPHCGSALEYRQGNPDFITCPHYITCGFKAIGARYVIQWAQREIAKLEKQLNGDTVAE